MVREKKAKIAALAVVASCIALHLITDAQDYGVYSGSRVTARFLYHFLHGSWPHLLINSFVFLQVVFIGSLSLAEMILSWAVASFLPVCWDTPTVGLSGMIYAMFGMMTWNAREPKLFAFCIFAYMAIGFFNPSSNACLHLSSYIAGLMVGVLFKRVD